MFTRAALRMTFAQRNNREDKIRGSSIIERKDFIFVLNFLDQESFDGTLLGKRREVELDKNKSTNQPGQIY